VTSRRSASSRAWLTLVLSACVACSGGKVATKADAQADGTGPADASQDLDTTDDLNDAAVDASTDASSPPEDTGTPEDTGPPDATLPTPPDGCTAQCALPDGTAKVCGSNGCGSVCGFCKTGFLCKPDGSECVKLCEPKCGAKKCGDNGCSGNCGTCLEKFHCGIDFLCHEDACVGNCKGKQCGDDGCGLSCGDCVDGDYCDGANQCKPGPCKGIPATGSCAGDILTTCTGSGAAGQKQVVDCGASAGKTCGWNPVDSQNECIVKPPCKPVCKTPDGKTKVCGDDGCGKPCGACPSGWTCKITSCEPQDGAACGTVTAQGKCVGETWVFCNTGKVSSVDCAAAGAKCGWDGQKFGCL
jgi:hypothetical protein